MWVGVASDLHRSPSDHMMSCDEMMVNQNKRHRGSPSVPFVTTASEESSRKRELSADKLPG